MLNTVIAALFVALLMSFNVKASGAVRDFSELVRNSDLIIYGEVREIIFFEDNSGFSSVDIEKTFKGAIDVERIRFYWGSSYTEQKISKALERYIFFLKNDNGKYVATIHGASAWEVVFLIENPGGSVVRPMPVKNLPETLYSRPGSLDCNQYRECSKARITLDTFSSYMKNIELTQK